MPRDRYLLFLWRQEYMLHAYIETGSQIYARPESPSCQILYAISWSRTGQLDLPGGSCPLLDISHNVIIYFATASHTALDLMLQKNCGRQDIFTHISKISKLLYQGLARVMRRPPITYHIRWLFTPRKAPT